MKALRLLIVFALIHQLSLPAMALDYSSYSLLKDKPQNAGHGSEYISGARSGSVLMKVNIWGGVGKPGIHHVPARTNLTNMLSYAGGPINNAALDEVYIKREMGKTRKKIEIDVSELIASGSTHNIVIEPNDIIVVPVEEPWISQNTVIVIGLISTMVTIVATGVIIHNNTRQ